MQNAIKGIIPEHFDNFRSPLNSSHGYNTRNGYLPRLPKVKTDWGRRVTSFQAINDWMTLPMELRRPMPRNNNSLKSGPATTLGSLSSRSSRGLKQLIVRSSEEMQGTWSYVVVVFLCVCVWEWGDLLFSYTACQN